MSANPAISFDGTNGRTAPIDTWPGSKPTVISGFAPATEVKVFLDSLVLGIFQTDDSGALETALLMPEADAGVHTLQIQGTTRKGDLIKLEQRVRYAGLPMAGGTYGMYLCCFEAHEKVAVSYNGVAEFFSSRTDRDGGVSFVLPVEPLSGQVEIPVTVTSQRTGKVLTDSIEVSTNSPQEGD